MKVRNFLFPTETERSRGPRVIPRCDLDRVRCQRGIIPAQTHKDTQDMIRNFIHTPKTRECAGGVIGNTLGLVEPGITMLVFTPVKPNPFLKGYQFETDRCALPCGGFFVFSPFAVSFFFFFFLSFLSFVYKLHPCIDRYGPKAYIRIPLVR